MLYLKAHGPQDMARWPVAAPGDNLNELVDLAVGTDDHILIGAHCTDVGIVTKRALLRVIQGREDATRPEWETA
jgi:glycine betaine/proline transport system ATP-binding protein